MYDTRNTASSVSVATALGVLTCRHVSMGSIRHFCDFRLPSAALCRTATATQIVAAAVIVSQVGQNRPDGRVTQRDLRVCTINDIGIVTYEVAYCSVNSKTILLRQLLWQEPEK